MIFALLIIEILTTDTKMEKKKKTRTGQVLELMHILAYLPFIGFMIEAGAILVSFVVSWINPEAANNLYKGLNLYGLRQFDFGQYALTISLLVMLAIQKSYVWYLAIVTLSKINLTNPFKPEMAARLEKMSYVLLGIWLVAEFSEAHAKWLGKNAGETYDAANAGEFLFMAGLIFIISQVFRRGVEIQSENELTV